MIKPSIKKFKCPHCGSTKLNIISMIEVERRLFEPIFENGHVTYSRVGSSFLDWVDSPSFSFTYCCYNCKQRWYDEDSLIRSGAFGKIMASEMHALFDRTRTKSIADEEGRDFEITLH
jgi:predicted nucleic-acid-binding Zn-ribbon protein